MTLDSSRDTVALFTSINQKATESYQRFFDQNFRPLPMGDQFSKEFKIKDAALSLNNRAVMARFKVLSHKLGRRISEKDNQQFLDFQEKLLEHACSIDSHVEEAQLNYMLLLWRRGKIFDEQFCTEITKRL